MKKIVTTLAVCGMAVASFAQGHVNFVNASGFQNVSTNISQDIFGNPTGLVGVGLVNGSGVEPNGYYYALLAQPYSGSGPTVPTTIGNLLTSGWTFTGAQGVNALGRGRIGGGADTITTAGMPLGGTNQFLVAGWSASLGSTWRQFPLNFKVAIGVTKVSLVYPALALVQLALALQKQYLVGHGVASPFTLYAVPIPEPSTIALAGLGGLSLLLFRRKK